MIACAIRAEAHWRAAEAGPREQATALRMQGQGHEIAENYAAARDAYRKSLSIHRSLDPEGEDVAIGLSDLADIDELTGNLNVSDRRRREALRIAQKVGSIELAATQTGNLAALSLIREDWPEAERLARKALEMAEAIGRQELIGSDCHCLAIALLQQGHAEEALPHAQRAVAVFTRLRYHGLDEAQALLRECEEVIAEAGREE